VVGTVVPWFAAWRYSRTLAWSITPFVFGVLVSTVYGRYHYAADVLGGVVVGAVAYWLALKWRDDRE
jgi:membrane-associated phospholipid phosphatase